MVTLTGVAILSQSLALYYLLVSYYPASLYCHSPDSPSWCLDRVPNVYSYVQKEHWKVGWLCSYEPKRALDIFWGMQTLLLVASSLVSFLRESGKQAFRQNQRHQWLSALWLYTLVLFCIAAFFAHIQSSTRFFSSNLFFYWHLARQMAEGTPLARFIPWYLALFNCAGHVLFSNFLVWV